MKNINNQKAFSLVEVMVALGLLTVVGLGAASQMSMLHSFAQFSYVQQARDQAVDRVSNLIVSPAALYWSAKQALPNGMLANCLLGNTGTPCTANTAYPLNLYVPNVNNLQLTGELDLVDGNFSSAPGEIFLDHKTGYPCPGVTAPTAQCPLGASATFTATCPRQSFDPTSAATSCNQAESIHITYSVRNADSGDPTLRAPAALKSAFNSVTVSSNSVALYKPQSQADGPNLGCTPGKVAVGIDGGGNVICQNLGYLCPAGTISVGLDRYGRPITQTSTVDGSQTGAFNSTGGVACVTATCGTLMTSMVNPTLPSPGVAYSADCFVAPSQCASGSSSASPQVLDDIYYNGGTLQNVCQTTSTCYQTDSTGSGGVPNYTAGYTAYGGTAPSSAITATCEAFGCGLGQFMTGWNADGSCIGK